MGKRGSFSELEYLVLAIVEDGKGSGYAIRKEMNRTKGGRWSAESGSVYRVLRRLEKLGLIEEAGKAGVPNRERTEYRITPRGKAEVDDWLTTPAPREELAYLVDPIRTRSYFLSRLEPDRRLKVLSQWLADSQTFCTHLERELEANAFNDTIRDAAHRNLLHLAKARHDWLKKLQAVVRAELKSSG